MPEYVCMIIDINKIKRDFPILSREINGKKLVYLDNAATSQKPVQVINAIKDYYENHNANIHRGAHTLGDEATALYEKSRETVAKFIGADKSEEVIFTKNTTDSLNMVAYGWGQKNINKGDKILVLISEHNSSFLPWQRLAQQKGAEIVPLYPDMHGKLDSEKVSRKIDERVKVVVLAHASNVLGTIFPVKEISKIAHEAGAIVVVDGAQAVPHVKVNVQSLGCDFYAFSGHKMLGPMGIGVLWGKYNLLENLEPFELGGGSVLTVSLESRELINIPDRFEAGTPNVADAVGLMAAIEYINYLGIENIRQHEIKLNTYVLKKLSEVPGLKILGSLNPEDRTGLVSFTLENIHPHDLASILNSEGVAVRSGMQCAMLLHNNLELSSSTRASYYIYNNEDDIDILVKGIYKAVKLLSGFES